MSSRYLYSDNTEALRRVRHKVTYYVMTFIFNQTNVESPYLYVYRAAITTTTYTTITCYLLLLITYLPLAFTILWRTVRLPLPLLLPSATFVPPSTPPCVTIIR